MVSVRFAVMINVRFSISVMVRVGDGFVDWS